MKQEEESDREGLFEQEESDIFNETQEQVQYDDIWKVLNMYFQKHGNK